MSNGLFDINGILGDLVEITRMLKSVDASVVEVNNIRLGKVDGIKLKNCYIKRYVAVGYAALIAIWAMCFLIIKICRELVSLGSDKGYFLMTVIILITLVATFILGRILLYTYRYMDECYFTKGGIVSIPILFMRHNSEFMIEKKFDGGVKKVYIKVIYTERNKNSNWRFEVLERENDAEEFLNSIHYM